MFLRTYTDRLSLLLMTTETAPLSQDTQRALQAAGISPAHMVIGSVVVGNDGVTVLSVGDAKTHRFDAIYSDLCTRSQRGLCKGLSMRMDSSNRLFVDAHQATSVDGVYAAGDLVRGLNQISVAEGEAASAATAVHNRLPKVFA